MSIKLKYVPRFPSQISDGPGISAVKQNGNWLVSLDYTDLPIVSPYTPTSTDYVLIWDSVHNSYFLAPASSFRL